MLSAAVSERSPDARGSTRHSGTPQPLHLARMSAQLIIGTYTESLPHVTGTAPGIITAEFENGRIGSVAVTAVRNPSWLICSSSGRNVYSVIESDHHGGRIGGAVAVLSRDVSSGTLTALQEVPSGGSEPVHLVLDPSESFVVVVNYGDGAVAVFPRRPTGTLGVPTQVVMHKGSSVHPIRQAGPHPHHACFDPVSGDLFVADLGLDAVIRYTFRDDGHISEKSRILLPPGSGPRHVEFHPDGEHLFVLNELASTLALFRRIDSSFSPVWSMSTLPPGFRSSNQAAAIRISEDGAHVYVSNRGHDSIAVFSFEASTGAAEMIQTVSTRGKTPRDFVFCPDETRILVANQDSDTVTTFRRDRSGRLEFVEQVEMATPVCLAFVRC